MEAPDWPFCPFPPVLFFSFFGQRAYAPPFLRAVSLGFEIDLSFLWRFFSARVQPPSRAAFPFTTGDSFPLLMSGLFRVLFFFFMISFRRFPLSFSLF